MHALRTSSILIRLVLAWFVLMLGVATASPIVHPQTMQVVCTSSGAMKVVVMSDDGQTSDHTPHTLDCSLCLAPTLPVPQQSMAHAVPQPLAHALKPEVAAHLAALVGAPLPPRGPPDLL